MFKLLRRWLKILRLRSQLHDELEYRKVLTDHLHALRSTPASILECDAEITRLRKEIRDVGNEK